MRLGAVLESVKVKSITVFISVCLLSLIMTYTISAQRDDSQSKIGSVAGNAYARSNFETINMTNGNLSINFPLASLQGARGGMGGSISLIYNSKMFEKYNATLRDYDKPCTSPTCPTFNAEIVAEKEGGGWEFSGGFELKYENKMDTYTRVDLNGPQEEPYIPVCFQNPEKWEEMSYIWKLNLQTPDGSSHEMIPLGHHEQKLDGFYRLRPDGLLENCGGNPMANSEPWVYYSRDGSYLRLVRTSATSWELYYPDGGKVVTASGIQTIYDKNGNFVVHSGHMITDNVGRSIYRIRNGDVDEVISSGVNGEEIKWEVTWKTITVKKNYQACAGPPYCPSPEERRSITSHFTVVDQIKMPDQLGGGIYEFSYNAPDFSSPPLTTSYGWGELSGVVFPSGGEVSYEYNMDGEDGPTLSEWSMNMVNDKVLENHPVKKTLTHLNEYDNTSSPVSEEWTYNISSSSGTTVNPDGSYTGISFGDLKTGGAYAGRVYSTSSSNGVTEINRWKEGPAYDCLSNCQYRNLFNPLLAARYTIIKDALGNDSLVSAQTNKYDKNGNLTETSEYDWFTYSQYIGRDSEQLVPTGVLPVRTTKTDYYNPSPEHTSINITDSNIYVFSSNPRLLRLPKSITVEDGSSNIKSRSYMEYDHINYSSYNTKAGNPILTRNWDSTKGAVSNPLTDGNSVKSQATYNAYGMPLTMTDAKGTVTQITYGNITTPTGTVSDLYPTQTVAAYGTGLARTSTATYDFFTGAVLTTTDVDNSITNAVEYDDVGRPVKSISALGTALEIWTTTEYDDELRRVIVRSDLEAKGDGKKVAIQHFDQLGRVRLARTLENSATESPYNETHGIKVQSRYKASGVCTFDSNKDCTFQLTSNPYRANYSYNETNSTMGWTLSQSRNDGRYSEVQTFAGAALPTAFGGANTNSTGVVKSFSDANASTVEDQAGKKRRSITNALGQLIRVDEPNNAGELGTVASPNQPTHYSYNILGNMVKVTQGVQNRYFMHDSLGRLLRVRQPEQEVNTGLNTTGNPDNNAWTMGATYDDNGNVLTATDANGVTITNTYDAMNRVLTRSYSDSTPTVSFYYDGNGLASVPDFSKGQLTRVSSSVSESRYTEFDGTGRFKQYQQITDGIAYTTKNTYNLSGGLIETEYPSGRVVKNVVDSNGELSMVQSRKNENHGYRNYAKHFNYTATGVIKHLQLGNGRWESAKINNLGQVTELNMGTSSTDGSLMKLKLEYGEFDTNGDVDITKNTGNVVRQTLSFSGLANPFVQEYKYDSLDRITEAKETNNGSQTWIQQFGYDRYGNRTSHAETIHGQHKPINEVTLPSIDGSTNRFSNPTHYEYDAVGNLITDVHGRQFIFNGDNKQVEVKDSNNNTIGEYRYDGNGKRIKKITASEYVVFVYDGLGRLIGEYSNEGPPNDPKVSFTATDPLGSPRVITDENGNIISRRDFMPFGEEVVADSTYRTAALKYGVGDNVRQKFTGYERDDETGLDFAEARYYFHNHGRFTAVDPLLASGKSANPQSFNRYVYVMNRPFVYTDPTGLQVAEKAEEVFLVIETWVSRFGELFNEIVRERGRSLLNQSTNISELDNLNYLRAQSRLDEVRGDEENDLRSRRVVGNQGPTVDSMVQGLTDAKETANQVAQTGIAINTILLPVGPAIGRSGSLATNRGTPVSGSNTPNTTLQIVDSVSKVMGNTYKAVGEVTAQIKNTDLINKLKNVSKGDWVKVYEAGIQNGKKVETHYFRNNTTGEVFDVKSKYNYWHQKAFKKLDQ